MNKDRVQFLLGAFVFRLVVVYIAKHIDETSTTNKFTDTDYEVFSDAATHVYNGASPFARHTYRYTPLAAYICLVNNLFHPLAGKVLFCLCDIVLGWIFWEIVDHQRNLLPADQKAKAWSTKSHVALWVYNPMIVVMPCRGSNDNVVSLLLFVALYALLSRRYILAGLFYGLSVHFKIYPIIYSFVLYFWIDMDYSKLAQNKAFEAIYSKKGFFTKDRLVFTTVSAGTFIGLTYLFYVIYGYEFVYEAYLYHFIRKDHRHNNSVYFYMIY
jgi:phosphatidylinositol glycan class M